MMANVITGIRIVDGNWLLLQAAYKALGCVHAEEIIPWIADEEPFDVQMEYVL